MHPLSGALPLPYMLAYVTHIVLWVLIGTCFRLLAVELLSTAGPICAPEVSLWNYLNDPVFDGLD